MSKKNGIKKWVYEEGAKVGDVRAGEVYWSEYLMSKIPARVDFEGLPETIPPEQIIYQTVMRGYTVIVKKNGDLYAPPEMSAYGYNVYHTPNKVVGSNAILGTFPTLTDGKNCVIVWAGPGERAQMCRSVLGSTVIRYAHLLAHLESTFKSSLVAQRSGLYGFAVDGDSQNAAMDLLEHLEVGLPNAVLDNKSAVDMQFKTLDFHPVGSITEFGQVRDYLINCFFREIGLTVFQEKKERFVSDEVDAVEDVSETQFAQYVKYLNEGLAKCKDVFGVTITAKEHEMQHTRQYDVDDEEEEEVNENED